MLDLDPIEAVCSRFGCQLKKEEPLCLHTTFQVGGACRALVMVNSEESLMALIKALQAQNMNFAILGRGSNVIAADEGFDGVVLKLGTAFSQITQPDAVTIQAQAGASLKSVCQKALACGLAGLEFAYGIPGTVGGGLYMNAGAYGGEMKDVVTQARYLSKDGTLSDISAQQMQLSYRHSLFSQNGGIITSVTFRLTPDDPALIRGRMDECMQKRRDKQPLEYPSAGSTFKRPQGDYASRLIEVCGLKGCTVGGAEVSRKHSGFVINKGGASCADILALTDQVRRTVQEQTGFVLELEPILLK